MRTEVLGMTKKVIIPAFFAIFAFSSGAQATLMLMQEVYFSDLFDSKATVLPDNVVEKFFGAPGAGETIVIPGTVFGSNPMAQVTETISNCVFDDDGCTQDEVPSWTDYHLGLTFVEDDLGERSD